MEITGISLQAINHGFKKLFDQGLQEPSKDWEEIAMLVLSNTEFTTHAWLGSPSGMREWLGDRVVKGLEGYQYILKNKKFEETIGVLRENIEDDNLGMYGSLMKAMGINVSNLPNELVFALLASGFDEECYDGQNFFDHDHPVMINGQEVSHSNLQDGSGSKWYLADMSKPYKPLIFQSRDKGEFIPHNDPNKSADVFNTDVFKYGTRRRGAAGFGLWQLIVGSKAELNAANFEAALLKLSSQKKENGSPAGIRATHLIIGEHHHGAAQKILNVERLENGATNPNKGRVQIMKSDWIAA